MLQVLAALAVIVRAWLLADAMLAPDAEVKLKALPVSKFEPLIWYAWPVPMLVLPSTAKLPTPAPALVIVSVEAEALLVSIENAVPLFCIAVVFVPIISVPPAAFRVRLPAPVPQVAAAAEVSVRAPALVLQVLAALAVIVRAVLATAVRLLAPLIAPALVTPKLPALIPVPPMMIPPLKVLAPAIVWATVLTMPGFVPSATPNVIVLPLMLAPLAIEVALKVPIVVTPLLAAAQVPPVTIPPTIVAFCKKLPLLQVVVAPATPFTR